MRYDVIIDPIVKKTFVHGAKPFYLCMLDKAFFNRQQSFDP